MKKKRKRPEETHCSYAFIFKSSLKDYFDILENTLFHVLVWRRSTKLDPGGDLKTGSRRKQLAWISLKVKNLPTISTKC